MIWYVVFCERKPGVYDSWGVYSGYVLGFSCAAYQSYFTRLEVEVAYDAFLEQQNKDLKAEHVAKLWSWKDLVILV
jgi:viroplasmin and RNaseH domain-containing protein